MTMRRKRRSKPAGGLGGESPPRERSSDPLVTRAMRRRPERAWRSVSRNMCRLSMEPRKVKSQGPTLCLERGRQHWCARKSRVYIGLAGVLDLVHAHKFSCTETGRSHRVWWEVGRRNSTEDAIEQRTYQPLARERPSIACGQSRKHIG